MGVFVKLGSSPRGPGWVQGFDCSNKSRYLLSRIAHSEMLLRRRKQTDKRMMPGSFDSQATPLVPFPFSPFRSQTQPSIVKPRFGLSSTYIELG